MKIKEAGGLMAAKRLLAKKYREKIVTNSELLKSHRDLVKKGKLPSAPGFERILRKRQIRTLSGIAPVAVLTKPFPCPGQCAYCPSEKDVPQSYLSNEPAVMRAIRCGYDPYKQVQLRLKALEANGHRPEKIELIIIGGTWSYLPNNYKYWYIGECFKAANEYSSKFSIFNPEYSGQFSNKFKIQNLKQQLKKEQEKNEKTKYRIIGITVETRPDYIDEKELWQLRELGVTRVELGVQAVDDKILALNKRGHGVKEIADATELLKDFGFKVTYHIMPGLPGATAARDLKLFKKLFTDERFQPDQLKFYPTVVTRGSRLYRWWKTGKYQPYSDAVLQKLIVKCKEAVPPYVRIIRLIRDIPGESIVAGNKITNLRQVLQARGVKCACIRCREIKDKEFKILNFKFKIIKYNASGGVEYFLQFTDKTGKYLYGFCRLRLTAHNTQHVTHNMQQATGHTAFIRELHVYGELVPVGEGKKIQHAGLGRKLMAEAEKIAREKGYKKIAVIAGIGVRDYYRKLGYKLSNSYMVKNI
ncbi:MAG: tRNA uridine(34) 5-carboxymethylaminomethyl modification radical SAM/GNAT enzyme Elp3 [Planctomycetes bacterium]|nr:tRNA uridine(34) 5-carboxymethylaminomethyl modification radical SAM/GNAT enzyme Elp3 [Planctomycetota bacterium]